MTQSKATAHPGGGHTYTLRKNGLVCVTSSIPGCGYSTQELKELHAAGYVLYVDGKKAKRTGA